MTVMRLFALAAGAGAVAVAVVMYVGFGAFLPWREDAEIEHLIELAGIKPGQVIAEVGAGTGRFATAFAAQVGPSGRVFATELSEQKRTAIAARVTREGHANVSIVSAERLRTGLPDECCDVVLLRNVYHHITEPDTFTRDLFRVVRPGGRVIVIDFEPGALWFHGGRPGDAATRRPGHGVSRAAVVGEFAAAGFRFDFDVPQWGGPMWLVALRRP